MKLTDQRKNHIAQKAFEGIAKFNLREHQNNYQSLLHEAQVEFHALVEKKLETLKKADAWLVKVGYISRYQRQLGLNELVSCGGNNNYRVMGAWASATDNSAKDLPSVPQLQIETEVGSSDIVNIPFHMLTQVLQDRIDAHNLLCNTRIQEINDLRRSIERPLQLSNTLDSLLAVWPSAKMLVPQQWYDEENERKENERARRAELKRRRVLAEQRELLDVEDERAELSDIDSALLVARMIGDLN
jgi:hypothetical protein